MRKIDFFKMTLNYLEENKIDVLYIKYIKVTPKFLIFLKKIRKEKLVKKIIIEEFDNDVEDVLNSKFEINSYSKIERILENVLDIILNTYIYKFVDKIALYSDNKEKYGVSAINISHGMNYMEKENFEAIRRKERNKNIVFTSTLKICWLHIRLFCRTEVLSD